MITGSEMAVVDENAAALGVPRKQLMESSGHAVASEVRQVADDGATIRILAGRGNNGGDAFVAARFLDGDDVTVHLLGRPESIGTDIARENWAALTAADYETRVVRDSRTLALDDPDVVVDALLGTGVTGAPRQPERAAVEAINGTDATVVAVDVPSGVDADTGEAAGVAVDADHVVTFHDAKPGLETLDATVTVADIGIPEAAERFTGPGDRRLLSRPADAHKGAFGEVLVVGGGPYTGAPALAGQAAMRAGADLVRVACPQAVASEVQGFEAGLIVRPFDGDRLRIDHLEHVHELAAAHDTVVLGPGLGDHEATLAAVRDFLADYGGRAVVDADALRVVPDVDTDATLLCTPHQGELRGMGGPSADDWRDRLDAVSDFAAELGHTLLVKGAYDVITDGERARVNRTGNPGMTVGGTGDVLAGAAGALLSTQGPVDAGALTAYANGLAGDRVVDRQGYGLLASDLLPELPRTLWGGADA